ncbi:carbon-nitrogen hydrolase [Fistulina hepatica ATCC 64428]|uniref:Carbon-nitrogen hydrolase n=1 Tax=Fistulina hepatica ATCC 64428 TaxID=1128425 RepID=A0A0D7AI86_9AGAR|nr:carbon-nitrogen hydrolase [Fistulina hepatica ATCC 64428]
MSQLHPQIVRVSVVQTCTQAYSMSRTLDKLEDLTRLAKERDNSRLCVFPEAFTGGKCPFDISVGGYPKMSTFGCVVGERSDRGREEFLRYHSNAIDLPSPELARIESISRKHDVFLVVGVIERDAGTLYCTVIFVDPTLGYVCKHRKLAPTAAERLIWGQGNGSTLAVVDKVFTTTSPDGKQLEAKAKISATICWENYMPLLRQYFYSQGVSIYTAPTVDARPVWQNSMVHIALEGRCFVLSACQYAQEKDYPPDHAARDAGARNPENVVIGGGSVIVNPLGKVLAGPLLEGEGVLTAEVDLNDCIRGKFDLDVVGHYARADVFHLEVNTK